MATAAKSRASAVKETTFLWEGKNKDGKQVRGEMRAASESVVQAKIRRQGITHTKVKKIRFKSGSRITEKDIAL
ncbi:MAG: type II secretion system F family protein, partial [Azonexus sp.]|nr:type II secretion system F family protein [Azonexus sp.]